MTPSEITRAPREIVEPDVLTLVRAVFALQASIQRRRARVSASWQRFETGGRSDIRHAVRVAAGLAMLLADEHRLSELLDACAEMLGRPTGCLARTRAGGLCHAPPMRDAEGRVLNGRCRIHGGARASRAAKIDPKFAAPAKSPRKGQRGSG